MDGPDNESINRFERFEEALAAMINIREPEDVDAFKMGKLSRILSTPNYLRYEAFINAAINREVAVLRKIAPRYPGIDVVGLAERLWLQVVVRRLE